MIYFGIFWDILGILEDFWGCLVIVRQVPLIIYTRSQYSFELALVHVLHSGDFPHFPPHTASIQVFSVLEDLVKTSSPDTVSDTAVTRLPLYTFGVGTHKTKQHFGPCFFPRLSLPPYICLLLEGLEKNCARREEGGGGGKKNMVARVFRRQRRIAA